MPFLHSKKEQFEDVIMLAYHQTGMITQAIEKDYYVTMLLRLLFGQIPQLVFKGGTSLSKCHRVIRRFSEDIDLTVDVPLSQGQKKKVKQASIQAAEELGMTIENIAETRSRRDYNRYILHYDSVLSVLNPAVLLETSYTGISFPTVKLPVYSYIGDIVEAEAPEMTKEFMLQPFSMKIQGIDRTLVDKIFAICDYYLDLSICASRSEHSRSSSQNHRRKSL